MGSGPADALSAFRDPPKRGRGVFSPSPRSSGFQVYFFVSFTVKINAADILWILAKYPSSGMLFFQDFVLFLPEPNQNPCFLMPSTEL